MYSTMSTITEFSIWRRSGPDLSVASCVALRTTTNSTSTSDSDTFMQNLKAAVEDVVNADKTWDTAFKDRKKNKKL